MEFDYSGYDLTEKQCQEWKQLMASEVWPPGLVAYVDKVLSRGSPLPKGPGMVVAEWIKAGKPGR